MIFCGGECYVLFCEDECRSWWSFWFVFWKNSHLYWQDWRAQKRWQRRGEETVHLCFQKAVSSLTSPLQRPLAVQPAVYLWTRSFTIWTNPNFSDVLKMLSVCDHFTRLEMEWKLKSWVARGDRCCVYLLSLNLLCQSQAFVKPETNVVVMLVNQSKFGKSGQVGSARDNITNGDRVGTGPPRSSYVHTFYF